MEMDPAAIHSQYDFLQLGEDDYKGRNERTNMELKAANSDEFMNKRRGQDSLLGNQVGLTGPTCDLFRCWRVKQRI